MDKYTRKLIEKNPGLVNPVERVLVGWTTVKEPKENSPVSEKYKYLFKVYAVYFFFMKLGPGYQNFISKITAFWPFSLMYQDRLFHAKNVKARDLMRGMENIAHAAGIPVYINNGYPERYFTVFLGKFEHGGINKQKAVEKMQQLFSEKYGTVYVQEEKTGFRVLVNK